MSEYQPKAMTTFSIESVGTHAEPDEAGNLVQWAEIHILVPKDFDWAKNGQKLLNRLEDLAKLIGRGL